MKSVAILCFLGVIAYAVGDSDKYNDKYDNINIDEVISNKRLLLSYLNCILEKGACTPEGAQLKGNFREAIQNYCEKCTEKQFAMTQRVSRVVYKEYPQYWKDINNLYDPEGKYTEQWMIKMGIP